MSEMLTMDAIYRLQEAGYAVEPADGIPGLWNVEGLARDITTRQLCDLSLNSGREWLKPSTGFRIANIV